MKRPKLSVLTDALPWGKELLREGARRTLRSMRDIVRPSRQFFNHPVYRGHFAVTRSLVEGLQKINADFNYNPLHLGRLSETVIVLAGVRTLQQAIRLKKQGIIKRLFAGPNIVSFSSDYDCIVCSPEIDCYVLNCDWTVDLYLEDCPTLSGRCYVWPAGVDTQYWKPDTTANRDTILIFEKQNKGPVGPVAPYAQYLRSLGWKVQIIKYGNFTHGQYLRALRESCLMLGFVTDESQGIAWAEAWSANVPTLIWKNTSNVLQGRRYVCSTAPYLSAQTGLFFDDLDDFKSQFSYWLTHRDQFSARAWVLENMSDEVCSSKLYKRAIEV